MKRLTVALPAHSYDILIEGGILSQIGTHIKKADKAFVVTDSVVAPLYLGKVLRSLTEAGFDCAELILPSGEETKCMDCFSQVLDALCMHRMTRSDVLIALGGGVIGDLAGFAAATYLRGIDYVQVPTSLLSQVDSAVGGKVAIDLKGGKNLAGAFYQPQRVLIDTEALTTLDDRIFFDGMGEVIKYGCIYDEALFALLENNTTRDELMAHMDDIVYTCLDLKRRVVERDERDTGERMALNFGHTIGHAVESMQQYKLLRHGEAVCVGMALITKLSENKGLTDQGTAARLTALLDKMGLPTTAAIKDGFWDAVQMDKKNLSGKMHLVLLKRIGECMIYPADKAFLLEVRKWLC